SFILPHPLLPTSRINAFRNVNLSRLHHHLLPHILPLCRQTCCCIRIQKSKSKVITMPQPRTIPLPSISSPRPRSPNPNVLYIPPRQTWIRFQNQSHHSSCNRTRCRRSSKRCCAITHRISMSDKRCRRYPTFASITSRHCHERCSTFSIPRRSFSIR